MKYDDRMHNTSAAFLALPFTLQLFQNPATELPHLGSNCYESVYCDHKSS